LGLADIRGHLVAVLSEYGGSHIAVLAEWASREAQTAGMEELYRSEHRAEAPKRHGSEQ
jgi:hypothetical protein